MPISRQLWVVVHRWAGLTLALFLIVAGATGALMPFYEELSDIAAPWRVVAAPHPGAVVLDPLTLRDRALKALPPGSAIDFFGLDVKPGRAERIYASLPPGQALPYDYIALDPYTGAVVHRGMHGRLADGTSELLPFLLRLHSSLALGEWGGWAFGIAALVWTIDCFIGFYLTLPLARRGWMRRWRAAWSVRVPPPSRYRLNFDLHRAGGLWLWPILLVFAWSSVGLNLRSIYDPVMNGLGLGRTVAGTVVGGKALPPNFRPDWRKEVATAQRLAAEEGRRSGFRVVQEGYISFDAQRGLFGYNFVSDRDIGKSAQSTLEFDVRGKVVSLGLADAGLTNGGADRWLMALHLAQIGGLPYRIFVSLLGLAVVALSVTGIVIWMKKRSARLLAKQRAPRRSKEQGAVIAAE